MESEELTDAEQTQLDELFKYVNETDDDEDKMLDYIEATYPEKVVKEWRELMFGLFQPRDSISP